MPGRSFNSSATRYGFNGMEKDDEVKGVGNHYSFGDFGYDSRLMRRWNIDPVVKYHESSYAAFANNPILFVDPTGLDTTIYFVDPKGVFDSKAQMFLARAAEIRPGGEDIHLYAHPDGGNISICGYNECFRKINSNYSISGFDGSRAQSTNNIRTGVLDSFKSDFVEGEELGDWSLVRISYAPVGELDVAYNGWLNKNGKNSDGTKGGSINDLFELPDGTLINSNEMGNFLIGYGTGYNGKVELETLMDRGDQYEGRADTPQESDDAHEKTMLRMGYEQGQKDRADAAGNKKQ